MLLQEAPKRDLPIQFPWPRTDARTIHPWLVKWTRLLDEAFLIPGTGYRIGIDGFMGLIPGVGDAITLVAAAFMIREAKRLGLPWHQQARMLANYSVDFAVGLVPIAGDIFDFAFKAHKKNLVILENHVKRSSPIASTR